jgi:uncharacterized protein
MDDQSTGTTCSRCGVLAVSDARFCGGCGKELSSDSAEAVDADVFKTLSPSLWYFFTMLVLLAVYKFAAIFPDGFEGFILVSVINILLVVAFLWNSPAGSIEIYLPRNLKFSVIILTILGALAGSALVGVIANAIQITIHDDVFYDMYLFEDTAYPYFAAVVFICLQPALFEEAAFRGFIFSNVQTLTSPNQAMYITGFLFGIIHLAFISMLWLVPLGFVFAFLRIRYNTIWYGVIGHFFYNLGVIVLEYTHLLDWR